jgi:vacuolar-type H+-ATPase subunit I/STV1
MAKTLFQKLGLTTVDPAQEAAEAAAAAKAALVTDEEEVEVPKAAKTKSGPKRPSAAPVDEEEDADEAPEVTGSADADTVKSLYKAIASGETEGFDFVKLQKMLKKTANLDEATRYSTAITAAEAMGMSAADLVASGQNSLKLLSSAEKQFTADLAEQEEVNEKNKQELAEVEAELESLNAKQKTLTKKIQNGTASVESQRKSFDASLETVSGEVKAIIANIKKYSK